MLKKLEQIAYYTGAPEKLLDENIFSELFDKDEVENCRSNLDIPEI